MRKRDKINFNVFGLIGGGAEGPFGILSLTIIVLVMLWLYFHH